MQITWFLARRFSAMIAVMFLVSVGIFSLIHLSPGNPIDILLGPVPRTPETVATLNERYHLDEPLYIQYWIWLTNALQGDFGTSIRTSLPVSQEIADRLPTTLALGIYAFIITVVGGATLGVLAGLRQGTNIDRVAVITAVAGMSIPSFVVGVLFLYLFAIVMPWFPTSGSGQGFIGSLWHLTLPSLSLALICGAYITRHVRAAYGRILGEDYLVFARARGVPSMRIFVTYLTKNAMIPIVTISGIVLSMLITGAVLIEVTFSISGIGQLLVQSARYQDIPMLQAVALFMATMVMLINLTTDLLYSFIDPRIRLGDGS
ncbi:ABC transporter permease [Nesterenkonia muleiensis]|uniref:ABC transporter permease n=1 Tax=Nesterenkonia muleiensis TaxID=2282648 RepID=UPI002368AF24|nr:ABC transporter permease [Nesterenkonia muleiensis]